jgi:hypothetical protein
MAASKKLNATAKISLGDASQYSVGRIVFQIVDDGSMSTSAVVKARVLGLADAELIAVPYTNRATGATVAASTAITAEGLYEVDAAGVEIVLDNTYTSGAGTVHYVPVAG